MFSIVYDNTEGSQLFARVLVFGFVPVSPPASATVDVPHMSNSTRRSAFGSQRSLQVAGPVFLSAAIATWVVGRIYTQLYEADWIRRRAQLMMQSSTIGGDGVAEHISSLLPQSVGSRAVVVEVVGDRRGTPTGQSSRSSIIPHGDLAALIARILGQRGR